MLEEARHKQEDFNRYLKKIRIGNKSEKQKKTLANINKLFKGRNDAIKFVDDYGSIILKAKRNAAEKEPEPTRTIKSKNYTQKNLYKDCVKNL